MLMLFFSLFSKFSHYFEAKKEELVAQYLWQSPQPAQAGFARERLCSRQQWEIGGVRVRARALSGCVWR